MNGCFKGCKLCLCLLEILSFNRDSQVSFLLNPLSALMNLFFNDVIVNLTETVITIITVSKQNFVSQINHILILIVDCNFEVTIQRIKELAISLKYSNLFILCCSGVVNILKTIAL